MYFMCVFFMFFPKSHIKLELLTCKMRAHIKMKNHQNVSGETLLLCRVLWARTTSALTMQLPCVVTNHKKQRSALKNQIHRTVFIYKVTSAKVRKSSNRKVQNTVLYQEYFIFAGEREDQQ